MRILAILAIFVCLTTVGAIAQQIAPGSPVMDLSPTAANVSGRFYGPVAPGPTSQAVAAANTLYAIPYFQPITSVAKNILFDVTASNASQWHARMCIYSDLNFSPNSLVIDGGSITISAAATGVQTSSLNSGSGVSLSGGSWYWLAWVADSAAESVAQTNGGGNAITQRQLGDSVNTGLFNQVQNAGVSG